MGFLPGSWKVFSLDSTIGWVLNLFSAGELWLSLLTNGGVGLLAGFLGRQVSQVTPFSLGGMVLLVSLVSGLLAAINFKGLDISQMWWMVESIVVPQACFDGAAGAGFYWLLSRRFDLTRLRNDRMAGLL